MTGGYLLLDTVVATDVPSTLSDSNYRTQISRVFFDSTHASGEGFLFFQMRGTWANVSHPDDGIDHLGAISVDPATHYV